MSDVVDAAVNSLQDYGFISLRENVFYAENACSGANLAVINCLKVIAANVSSQRARICFHPDGDSVVQEMLIVFTKETFLHPIKQHKSSSLTYVAMEGEAQLLQFNTDGAVEKVTTLGSQGMACYRLPANCARTLRVTDDFFVFYEIAEGPFEDKDTVKVAPYYGGSEADGRAWLDSIFEE